MGPVRESQWDVIMTKEKTSKTIRIDNRDGVGKSYCPSDADSPILLLVSLGQIG